MKYKDYNSKFSNLVENVISRYQTGGASVGDFCTIRKDAIKSDYVKSKPQNFIDMVRHAMESGLHLKIGSIKSERADMQNDLGTAPTGQLFVDVVVEYAPGLWRDPITLPIECIDIVFPDGNNWSPEIPDSMKHHPKQTIKPEEVSLDNKELNDRTNSNKRAMPKKNEKLEITPKEPKDGRESTKVKESLTEVYGKMLV